MATVDSRGVPIHCDVIGSGTQMPDDVIAVVDAVGRFLKREVLSGR